MEFLAHEAGYKVEFIHNKHTLHNTFFGIELARLLLTAASFILFTFKKTILFDLEWWQLILLVITTIGLGLTHCMNHSVAHALDEGQDQEHSTTPAADITVGVYCQQQSLAARKNQAHILRKCSKKLTIDL